MFLKELKSVEKEKFIEVVHLIAKANGIVDKAEQKMLDVYEGEMGIKIDINKIKEKKPERNRRIYRE